jgi:excisionase family DNA binding protein
MEQQRGLFVRLPAAAAEKLDRASFELKTPKRELVASLVERHLGSAETVVGRAAVSAREPDVLTLEQLAGLLQVDEKTVRALAASGDLPGRKVGRHWRFSRQAVLDWLATPDRRRGAAGFQG